MSKDDQRALDGRHRDASGQIRRKKGNREVRSLHGTYGDSFAGGSRDNMKLSTLLDRSGFDALSSYLHSDNPTVP